MENHVWHPLAHSSLRYTRRGTLQPTHVEESSMCYRPNVRKVTAGSYAFHNFVNNTFHHTSTHNLGPEEIFGGILVLWQSSTPQYGDICASAGLPP